MSNNPNLGVEREDISGSAGIAVVVAGRTEVVVGFEERRLGLVHIGFVVVWVGFAGPGVGD